MRARWELDGLISAVITCTGVLCLNLDISVKTRVWKEIETEIETRTSDIVSARSRGSNTSIQILGKRCICTQYYGFITSSVFFPLWFARLARPHREFMRQTSHPRRVREVDQTSQAPLQT